MKKQKIIILLLLIGFCITAKAQLEGRHYRSEAFKGTWGVRVLLPTAYDLNFPDGSGVNAENFDVDLFMQQIDQLTTITHVNINIGRGHQASWYSSPYPEMEAIMGSDLFSERDFFGEVVDALIARGLKVIVYFSKTGMDAGYLTSAQMATWNAHLAANNLTHHEGVAQIIKYYAVKYGNKIDGWWIDRAGNMSTADHGLYVSAMRTGNPDAMIAFHVKTGMPIRQGTKFCDYTAGHPVPVNSQPTWTLSNVGMVENIEAGPWIDQNGNPDASEGTALGAILMPFQRKWRDGAADFPTNQAIEWTIRSMKADGMYSWAVAREGNGFASPQFSQLLEINAAIEEEFGTGGGTTNLAYNAPATQSTTLGAAVASRANDGDTNGNFGGDSVSAAGGPNAWWEVDLEGSYSVDDIVIFNRTNNCCKARLSDFTVSVINSSGTTTFTQTITSTPNPSITLDAGGAIGEVVRIQSNLTETLNLAEVEVYGSESGSTKLDQTITFNLPAKQLGDADFDPATASSGYNISYTSSNTNVATIVNGNISIVGVGTSEITASQAGNVVYNAAPSVTRTLVVTNGNTGGSTNLAYNAPATQSTTLGAAVASRANDGDTNGNFGGDSVSAAGGPNAWWEVDLEGSYSVDDIVIFNRTNNCCINRLSDFTVSVINSSGTTTFTQTITTAPNPSLTLNAGGAVGEVVRIQSNLTTTLNLAEVEVYGTGSNNTTNNTITIQENATGFCDVDGVIQSADAGYTGSGYANTSNALGRAIDWEIAGAAGSYTFVWRYLVGSARTANLIVDGTTEASGISFDNTQGGWLTATTTVTLSSGVKSVILSSTSSTGLAKIDYVEVTGPNAAVSGCTNSSKTSSGKTDFDVETSDADGVLYTFPNPVSDILNIKISGSKSATLDIMNNLGQHVFTQDLKGSSTAVDLRDLSSGIYILKVTDEQHVQTKKIIKK